MIVVMLESRIAENALSKPAETDALIVLPTFNSSFILSNMIQSASTAIPIERTIPAIPERLRLTWNISPTYINNEISAIRPGILYIITIKIIIRMIPIAAAKRLVGSAFAPSSAPTVS